MRDNNKFQNNGAWHNARTGKLTASRMAAAMSYLKNGQDSEARKKLKVEILAERLTGNIVPKFINEAMQWGLDHEPLAKDRFEQQTGFFIDDVGFVDHPEIDNLGCSPDGYISNGYLIEIKCPTTVTHLSYLINKKIPEEYKPQLCLQSLVTGKRDITFLSFDPRMPEKQQLFMIDYQPTAEELDKVKTEAIKFLNEVDELFLKITHG